MESSEPSPSFCAFWQNDTTHDLLLSYLPPRELKKLRLVCRPFADDVARVLFTDVIINFKPNTFSRQARMNALERIGHHVQGVKFSMPHTPDTFLPPLLDAEGEEHTFNYRPEVELNGPSEHRFSETKFGSPDIMDLLIMEYPPIFHAATNIWGFIRCLEATPNMRSLSISCPDQPAQHRYRRSAVDYALVSLRMAVERVAPKYLRSLTLAPVHSMAPLYLRPDISLGSSPRSSSVWRRVTSLTIEIECYATCAKFTTDQYKIMHTYLRTFTSLEYLDFTWLGSSGPMPLSFHTEPSMCVPERSRPLTPPYTPPGTYPPSPDGLVPPTLFARIPVETMPFTHPLLRPLRFRKLERFFLRNALITSASQVADFIHTNRHTLLEFSFQETNILRGNWDEAMEPLNAIHGSDKWKPRYKRHIKHKKSADSQKSVRFADQEPYPPLPKHLCPQPPRPKPRDTFSMTSSLIHDGDSTLEVPLLLSLSQSTLKPPSHPSRPPTATSSSDEECVEGPLWEDVDTYRLEPYTPFIRPGMDNKCVMRVLGRTLGKIVRGGRKGKWEKWADEVERVRAGKGFVEAMDLAWRIRTGGRMEW